MSELDGTAWGSPQVGLAADDGDARAGPHGLGADAGADADAAPEPPLQYAALWAESQPSGNTVALQQLGRVLARAGIANETCAYILEDSALPGQARVGEPQFYRALALAALAQQRPDFDVRAAGAEPMAVAVAAAGAGPGAGAGAGGAMPEIKLSAEPPAAVDESLPEYNPTSAHTIHVELMSKREGSFLSRHAVYTVSGEFQDKPFRVLRRFRDFAWLADSLVRKYPFRVVPTLPPKRLVMNGTYLTGASQDSFLQRRAEGLARFVNLLVKHPVLAADALVRTFLFAETQFELVRGRAPPQDEFSRKVASPLFISQWSDDRLGQWAQIEGAAQEFLQQVTSLCVALERARARAQAASDDAEVLGRNCLALSRSLYALYPSQQEDLGAIQTRLESVGQFSEASKSAYAEQSDALAAGPLGELRIYREMLSSVLDLFQRYHTQGGNTIPELERKIGVNQKKLAALATKEDASEDALHKLRTAIQAAQTSIRDQINRDWLVKRAMTEELEIMQAMQYQISRILRSFATAVDASAARQAELASQMADAAGTAPLKI